MGTLFETRCPSCGYSKMVSGGEDAGMACLTTTIACKDCRELYDAVVSDKPWLGPKRSGDLKLICPGHSDGDDDDLFFERRHANPNHRVEEWTYPGPCPRCGETLVRGDGIVMWD